MRLYRTVAMMLSLCLFFCATTCPSTATAQSVSPIAGDIDGNNVLTGSDVRQVLFDLVNLTSCLTPSQQQTADVNFDGVITTADVRNILYMVVNDISLPLAVKKEATDVVKNAVSHRDERVLRFIISSDVHQNNDNALITKGTQELAAAHREILSQIDVDFVANLGDIAWGAYANTTREVTEQIRTFHSFMGDAVNGQTLLYLEGNHDDANYSTVEINGTAADDHKLSAEEIYNHIWSKNTDVVYDPDHRLDGYCYKDLAEQKVRVICLNTEQGDGDGGVIAGYQLKWFAETALDMSGKEDWSVITLAHHPLDYPMLSLFRDATTIVEAFLNGADLKFTTSDGTSVAMDYRTKSCQYVAHFHGHTHAFSVTRLRKYQSAAPTSSYTDLNAYQICIPNACYSRTNPHIDNENPRFRRYSTEISYNKSDVDGQRTSFNVVTICLDDQTIYADNYGAGVNRIIRYD